MPQTGFSARRLPATGDVFTRLTVIALPASGTQVLSRDHWLCRCACSGREVKVLGSRLLYDGGHTRSCGCLRTEAREALKSEFRRRHAALVSWKGMLRLHDVEVDPVWRESFEGFFAVLGERPEGYVLSRKDLSGPFDAKNCFWEPRRAQVERVRARRWATPNAIGWDEGPRKHCSKCGEEKLVGEFYKNKKSKTKLHTSCKKCCEDVRRRLYRENVPRRLLASARNRALEKGLAFDLTEEDLLPIPTHCPVFGIELTFGGKDGRHRQDSSGRMVGIGRILRTALIV